MNDFNKKLVEHVESEYGPPCNTEDDFPSGFYRGAEWSQDYFVSLSKSVIGPGQTVSIESLHAVIGALKAENESLREEIEELRKNIYEATHR